MFGSDSAHQSPSDKRKDPPAPGVYTAPYHLELLGKVIGDKSSLVMFTSGAAREFYCEEDGGMVEIRDEVPSNVCDILRTIGSDR